MGVRKVTMAGREYVLVPRADWEAMTGKRASGPGKPLALPPPSRDGSYTLEHVRLSLANKMTARRKAAGLTQARLAKLARVRVETISRLENGLHMPSVRTFDRIDRALARAARRPAA
jgi:DNA-binding XRE family transcriptional regulator